jgi:hypothetical protein
MKEDEIWLIKQLYTEELKKPEFTIKSLWEPLQYKTPREIIEEQTEYNHKRLWYVLDKLSQKGYVEYGTSLGSAWLTDKGIEMAKQL